MLRGVRGATTVDQNDRSTILERTAELLNELVAANNITTEDIGAVIFSATPDITAAFPAAAARTIGWTEVPLFDAQQIDCDTGLPLCIRILVLWNTDILQQSICHIYLNGAQVLRPDLVKNK